MSEEVVIDASLAAMWVLPELHSQEALMPAHDWSEAGVHLLAPCLLLAEVTNAVYKRVVRGELDMPIAQAALELILGFDVGIREEPGLPARAMTLANQLGRPSTYDCHYAALAERHHCEFWTGDQRFYHAAKDAISWVRWVGEYEATPLNPENRGQP